MRIVLGPVSSCVPLVLGLALFGCNDPKDPQTWIKRLRDRDQASEAVKRLQELGDPVAVEPLCKLFADYPSATILKAIISFKDKRAIPTLVSALDFTEDSYSNATRAANALAEMKATEAVPALIKVLEKDLPVKSRANLAKQHAIEALAAIGGPEAVPALIAVVDRRPDKQDFHLNKVAVIALGRLGDKRAVGALIRALFMQTRLHGSSFPQAHVALVRIGQDAVPGLKKALAGQDRKLAALVRELNVARETLVRKIAVVAGDLQAKVLLPQLLTEFKALAKANAPRSSGWIEALGKIGDGRALSPLLSVLTDASRSFRLRIETTTALTLLGNQRALNALLEVGRTGHIQGDKWDLRLSAIQAYSRLVGAKVSAGRALLKSMKSEIERKKLPGAKQLVSIIDECLARLDVVETCGKKLECYTKILTAKKEGIPRREKAGIMVGHLQDGRKGLPALVEALPDRNPVLRQFLLETAKRVGKGTDSDLVATLEKLVEKDSKRRARHHGADFARLDKIALAVVSQRK